MSAQWNFHTDVVGEWLYLLIVQKFRKKKLNTRSKNEGKINNVVISGWICYKNITLIERSLRDNKNFNY